MITYAVSQSVYKFVKLAKGKCWSHTQRTTASKYWGNSHWYCQLTHERYSVSTDGQQVVHDEQEDRVAQDEGHLEKGAVAAVGRQQEAEQVHCDEEAAGDQQVHHIQGGPTLHRDLQKSRQQLVNLTSCFSGADGDAYYFLA